MKTPDNKNRIPFNHLIAPHAYQKWVEDVSWYGPHNRGDVFEWAYLFGGLVGEAGEAADEFKKALRQCNSQEEFIEALTGRMPKLLDEVGDVLWYIAAICNALQITLQELMFYNAGKLHLRHKEDHPEQQFVTPEITDDRIKDIRSEILVDVLGMVQERYDNARARV